MDDQLPGMPDPPAPAVELSAERRRTIRARQCIAWGQHPFGPRLRIPPGETCGSCAHAVQLDYHGRRYWKCPVTRGLAHSAASDLRISWPACERWQPKPKEKP